MEPSLPKNALLFFDANVLIYLAADLIAARAYLGWLSPSHELLTSEGALHQYQPRGDEPTVTDLRTLLVNHGVVIVPDSSAFDALAKMDRARPRRNYKGTDVVLWQTFRNVVEERAAPAGVFVSDDGDFFGEHSVQKLFGDDDDGKCVALRILEVFGPTESRHDAAFLRNWISIVEDGELLCAAGLPSGPGTRLQVLRVNGPTIERTSSSQTDIRYRIRVGFDFRITVPDEFVLGDRQFPIDPEGKGAWTTERQVLIEYDVLVAAQDGVPNGIGMQRSAPRFLDPTTGEELKFA
ncbi:MAG: hypothetical protein KAI24_13215 [Planctomycetes bacterium]|nr:hypothetical protein [Planctomycetota bacterium]